MDRTFHVALTGHRPHKLDGYRLTTPFYARVRARLDALLEEGLTRHEHLTCHSGLALGADTLWSQAILAARERHPGRIGFVAEVPVMTQSDRWPSAHDRAFWQRQIDAADHVNVYAETYSPACLKARNAGMVRAADLLIALWDGSPSGTAHAVGLARERRIGLIQLRPDDFR